MIQNQVSDLNDSVQVAQASGRNPHYRPPIMRWNQVEIIAPEGYGFGIAHDSDGLLSIVVRPPGQPWPHEMESRVRGTNVIAEGCKAYVVSNDERGPAAGHDFEPDPADPSKCSVCAAAGDALADSPEEHQQEP